MHLLCQQAYRVERYAPSEATEALAREIYTRAAELENASADFMLGFCLLWRGKLGEAEDCFERGCEAARSRGWALIETRCLVYGSIARRRCATTSKGPARGCSSSRRRRSSTATGGSWLRTAPGLPCATAISSGRRLAARRHLPTGTRTCPRIALRVDGPLPAARGRACTRPSRRSSRARTRDARRVAAAAPGRARRGPLAGGRARARSSRSSGRSSFRAFERLRVAVGQPARSTPFGGSVKRLRVTPTVGDSSRVRITHQGQRCGGRPGVAVTRGQEAVPRSEGPAGDGERGLGGNPAPPHFSARPESRAAARNEKGRRRPPPLSPIAPGLADCRQSQPWSRPRYRHPPWPP